MGTLASQPHPSLVATPRQPKPTPHMGTAAATAAGLIRPPNVTVTHTRTITNVTQAQTRSMMAAAVVSSSQVARTATTPAGVSVCVSATTSSSPPAVAGARITAASSSSMAGTRSSPARSKTGTPVHAGDKCHVRANPGAVDASTRSPRGGRKSHYHKHLAGTRVSVATSSPSNQSAAAKLSAAATATLHHSMATNSTVTPPNVVIGGATAVAPVPTGATGGPTKHKDGDSRVS